MCGSLLPKHVAKMRLFVITQAHAEPIKRLASTGEFRRQLGSVRKFQNSAL